MPAKYQHRPVPDAQEPCPVCGEVQYEEYFPTEDWRAGRGIKGADSFEPSPLVVCRVCGHHEQAGGIVRFERGEDPDEDEAAQAARMARLRAEQTAQRWHSDKITLMAVTFPIYAAEGWAARIHGSGSQGDDITQLTIAHARTLPDSVFIQRPRIEITSSIDPHHPCELTIARDVFGSSIDADADGQPTEGLSDAALTLWFRAARRRRVARSQHAAVSETEITIDGARHPFVTVGTPHALWVAVRRHEGVMITITGHEIDPTSLIVEPVADPNARLLGPEPIEP